MAEIPFEPYTGQSKLRFWCQKVLPLVYDESLSYYELLCKVVKYLNNTISDVSACEDNITALRDAFVQLQDYVNEQFEDFAPEVERIIDEMIDSGEFGEIIADVVNGLIAGEYSTTQGYAQFDYVLKDGKLYCATASTSGEWDATKWRETTVGADMQLLNQRVYNLNAGQVAFNESTTYDDNTVGKKLKDLDDFDDNLNAGQVAFNESTTYDNNTVGKKLKDLDDFGDNLNAGQVEYNSENTYNNATVGKELQELKGAINSLDSDDITNVSTAVSGTKVTNAIDNLKGAMTPATVTLTPSATYISESNLVCKKNENVVSISGNFTLAQYAATNDVLFSGFPHHEIELAGSISGSLDGTIIGLNVRLKINSSGELVPWWNSSSALMKSGNVISLVATYMLDGNGNIDASSNTLKLASELGYAYVPHTIQYGAYDYDSSTFTNYSNYQCAVVDVNPGEEYKISCFLYGASQLPCAMFFDANMTAIGRTTPVSSDTHFVNEDVTIPSNCKYMAVHNVPYGDNGGGPAIYRMNILKKSLIFKTHPLVGKRVVVFGDSITYIPNRWRDTFFTLTGAVQDLCLSYAGAHLANYSGTVLDGNYATDADNNIHNTVCNQVYNFLHNLNTQYKNINPDVFIISAGANDGGDVDAYAQSTDINVYNNASGWIDEDTLDLTTFDGAMRWIHSKLSDAFPNAKIIFCSPIQYAVQYHQNIINITVAKEQKMERVCNRLSDLLIKAGTKSGITSEHETANASGRYFSDGIHPNAYGGKVLGTYYANAVSAMFPTSETIDL